MIQNSLIENITKGDENAFRELIDLYKNKVYNTIYQFTQNHDDTQDISQDVFMEIFLSANKFRNESSVATWIYRIAVNKAINYIKKNKYHRLTLKLKNVFFTTHKDESFPEPYDTSILPDAKLENNELALLLQNAINTLPENQKTAFILHKSEDLSYKEISEIMKISLASVESLMHRARKNLQKKLLSNNKNYFFNH